jgi:hypothetical protein
MAGLLVLMMVFHFSILSRCFLALLGISDRADQKMPRCDERGHDKVNVLLTGEHDERM